MRVAHARWPGRDTTFPSTLTAAAVRAGGLVLPTVGPAIADWIERTCVLPSGPRIGQPWRLLPWQRRLLAELYAVDLDDRPPGWRRRHRWAMIGTPKKAGKTSLLAALALWHLVADPVEDAPVVVCAAASDEQADLLFGAARTMVELSPVLARVCQPRQREILVPGKPGASLRRLAAAAGTNDGLNVSVALFDELHEWTGRRREQVWHVLSNAVVARPQPLVLQISTAGENPDTICGAQWEHVLRVRDGEVEDPTFYGVWWAAPEDAPWDSPCTWAFHPSWGTTVTESQMAEQARRKPEAVFRRYFLNQWVSWSEHAGQLLAPWDACTVPADEWRDDPEAPMWVGIDASHRQDCTTVVAVQDLDGVLYARWRLWANPFARTDPRRRTWAVPLDEVEQHLRDLHQRYPAPAGLDEHDRPVPGPLVLYDPAWLQRSAAVLAEDGLHMLEVPQTDSRMIPATVALMDALHARRLRHVADPVWRRHIAAAALREKPRGFRLGRPAGSQAPIDGAVALALAVHAWQLRALRSGNAPVQVF